MYVLKYARLTRKRTWIAVIFVVTFVVLVVGLRRINTIQNEEVKEVLDVTTPQRLVHLTSLLMSEKERIENLFGGKTKLLQDAVRHWSPLAYNRNTHKLSQRLTASFLNNQLPFVIGVNAGSPSTYEWGYVNYIRDWLRTNMSMPLTTVRNGAIGSMTQWFFASCAKTILGNVDDIDVLIWEFAVNEDVWALEGRDPSIRHQYRARAAEIWLRQAWTLYPSVAAVAFVHMYTYDVWGWTPNITDIPNTCRPLEYSFHATEPMLAHYRSATSCDLLSLNVIGTLCDLGLVKNKWPDFLKDRLHPTKQTHDLVGNLMIYLLLTQWLDGLRADNAPAATSSIDVTRLPLFSPNQVQSVKRGWEIPSQTRWSSSCFMPSLPQMLSREQNPIQPVSSWNFSMLMASMDPDPYRQDRVAFIQIPECASNHTGTEPNAGFNVKLLPDTKVLYLVWYLTLRGKPTCKGCGEASLRVWLNGHQVNSNINLRGAKDTAEEVNNWIYKMDVSDFNNGVQVRACSISPKLYFVAFILWERKESR